MDNTGQAAHLWQHHLMWWFPMLDIRLQHCWVFQGTSEMFFALVVALAVTHTVTVTFAVTVTLAVTLALTHVTPAGHESSSQVQLCAG